MSVFDAENNAGEGAASVGGHEPILDLIGNVRDALPEPKVDEIWEELLAEAVAKFGPTSREVLTLRVHHVQWLATGQDYRDGAREWDSLILDMVRDACGDSAEVPDWHDIQAAFSYLHEDESRAEEIISLSQELLPEILTEFGRTHEFAVAISHEIYFWFNELERFAEAARAAGEHARICSESYGDEHGDTLLAQAKLGIVMIKSGDAQRGEVRYAKAVADMHAHLDAFDSRIRFVESEYGLLTADRVEEPEDYERLEKAVEHYRQTDGPEAERTLQFAQHLFREYLHLGRKRDAAQLAAKYNLNIE